MYAGKVKKADANLPRTMSKNETFRVVLTGPESTGKTTMSASLSADLGLPVVPEFARTFLSGLKRPYTHRDLLSIYRGQCAWEQWYGKQSPVLLCDTDWTVLYIWERIGFEQAPPLIPRVKSEHPTVYLLCSPDIPWEPDPLREHPKSRAALFERYHDLLTCLNADFIILGGDHEKRRSTALNFLKDRLHLSL